MKPMIKLDCGKHHGAGGRCSKCGSGVTQRDIASQRDRALIAAIQPVNQSLQERAIESAKRYNLGIY